MATLNLNDPVIILSGNEFLPEPGIHGKKQMTSMMAAPILIGSDSFICVVVVIYNLQKRRLYLHETFLTEKIPEIAASSLVRGISAASPQSQGNIAKILLSFINSK